MMVPIQVIRWYRMQCYDGTDSCATVVPIRRYCQFTANQKIDLKFSGFRIMRHPTMDGIYGVTLRQQYKSDRYADDGYLFLLWDFRNPSMPLIHVRTWQPAGTVHSGDDVISIQDFNLE